MRYTLVLLALWQAGCSVIFVEKPPERHAQMPYFACTDSNGPAIADSIVGGLFAYAAVVPEDQAKPQDKIEPSIRIARGVLAAALAASAIYGYTQVSHCDAAKAELAARMYVPPPMPAQLPVPPVLGPQR